MENLCFAFVFLGPLSGVLPWWLAGFPAPWVGHTPQQRKDSGKLECIVIQKHLQGVVSGDLSSYQERK